jgi:hypothetical protein
MNEPTISQLAEMISASDSYSKLLSLVSNRPSFRNYPSNNKNHSFGKKAKSLKKRSNNRKRK